MKNSIIYFGIALLLFNRMHALNSVNNETHIFQKAKAVEIEESAISCIEIKQNKNNTFAPVEDQMLFFPEIVINSDNQKDIEQIITENNQIIESKLEYNDEILFIEKPIEEIIMANNQIIESAISNGIQPLYLERTMEDLIIENNTIIENNINNEIQLLDFNQINKSQSVYKQISNKISIDGN